jgi:hypothetical protein
LCTGRATDTRGIFSLSYVQTIEKYEEQKYEEHGKIQGLSDVENNIKSEWQWPKERNFTARPVHDSVTGP